ncbi:MULTISPECIES: DUF3618 domain-containing protein [Streptomyces]|uniref:DUF3618 domain-containing protein n=1 Tax=Streptomyces lycii TaxID=2654337 RepID=A0ABQ7FNY0_9ACTN|nr:MULTISPECIES: DUF3618 domain-containing protein [Streptomyces]KAF4410636.1 DUF3618 domain-containing protein [Streptomyces lycii]PGH47812.1 hypothetical protein CRI70_26470 [Streptomyces sp. Ru87]
MTSTPEELRAEVVRARERLGDTVEQLAARADVKSRARARAAEMRAEVEHEVRRVRPAPVLTAAGVLTAVLVLLVVRGRRAESGRG